MFSLIAFVCDDDDLQKKLPQILVVSSAVVKALAVEQMRRTLPPNVFLWSQRRAWTTGELMVAVVKTLRQCLESDLVDRQVILSSDVFRAHTTKAVWRALARLNFFYFLIPARMTWVMQPCDTHVFAQFKRHLQEAAQTAAVRDQKGYVPLATLFDIVGDTVQVVLRGKRWAHAFHDLGLAGNQEGLSASVLQKLGLAAAPQVGASLPTLAQLQEIWPTNAVIPIDLAFGTVTKYARACAPGELKVMSGGFFPARRGDFGLWAARSIGRAMADDGANPGASSPSASGAGGSAPVAEPAKPAAFAAAAASVVEKLQQQGGGADELLNSIGRLKEEQAALRAEKKKVGKALKNAEKRRSRLKKKARQLSDTDLVAVLQMRAASKSDDKDGAAPKKVQKAVDSEPTD